MSTNQSRREFLKMASALSASGALAWLPDLTPDKSTPKAILAHEGAAVPMTEIETEEPFVPYDVGKLRLWERGPDGEYKYADET